MYNMDNYHKIFPVSPFLFGALVSRQPSWNRKQIYTCKSLNYSVMSIMQNCLANNPFNGILFDHANTSHISRVRTLGHMRTGNTGCIQQRIKVFENEL